MCYKKFLGMGSKKFLGMNARNSSELILIYSQEIFTRKSSVPSKPLPLYGIHPKNFSMERLLEISADS